MKTSFFIFGLLLLIPQIVFSGPNQLTTSKDIVIIIKDEGYYPEQINLFVGERPKLFILSQTESQSCFIMQEKNIFLPLEKGKMVELNLQFDKPGIFPYFCPKGGIGWFWPVVFLMMQLLVF